MNRPFTIAAGFLAVTTVIAPSTAALAAPTGTEKSVTADSGTQNPEVVHNAAFENARLVNNTNTPLHFVTQGSSAAVTVEPGQRANLDERMNALVVYAGRDATGPVWADFSYLSTQVESMVPDARGYLRADGVVTDPDSRQQTTFSTPTGSTDKWELGRKSFSLKFWQVTKPDFWMPYAEITFGGQFEEQFPRESTVTVKNRTKVPYTVAGERIDYMQDADVTAPTPAEPQSIGRIEPVTTGTTGYPATSMNLSVPSDRTKASSLTFSDPESGRQYFKAENLWGMKGKWFGRLDPHNGVTMTVKREDDVRGKAHFVVTIYNV